MMLIAKLRTLEALTEELARLAERMVSGLLQVTDRVARVEQVQQDLPNLLRGEMLAEIQRALAHTAEEISRLNALCYSLQQTARSHAQRDPPRLAPALGDGKPSAAPAPFSPPITSGPRKYGSHETDPE